LNNLNSTNDKVLNSLVLEEAAAYKDIEIFENLSEDYYVLPQKVRRETG
jgi:hypothetical protein